MAAKRLFLIDGTYLAYRSFFAFLSNPLTTSKGLNTSAVFGFTQALTKLMEAEPDGDIVVAWDASGPTKRHTAYAEYKATRQKMPDEMVGQLPYVEKVATAYGLPFLAMPGFEADDIIGTLACQGASKGIRVAIVAGDKDFMQLVGERISLWLPRPGAEFEKLSADGVKQKMGVPPSRVIDLLGLMGDSSDNVPGIRGVGPKTALDLLGQFETLEGVLAGTAQMKSRKLAEKIDASHAEALLSKELVTIDTNVPVSLDDVMGRRHPPDVEALKGLFTELEFTGLLKTLARAQAPPESAYRTAATFVELDRLVRSLRAAPEWVFHAAVEAPGRLAGIAFAWEPGSAVFVPREAPSGEDCAQPLLEVAPLLHDASIQKGSHDAKEAMKLLARHGVAVRGLAFDPMLASYLADPSQRQASLEYLCMKHLGVRPSRAAVTADGQRQLPLGDVAEDAARLACEDADLTLRLHRHFAPTLAALGVERLYRELELPLVEVLMAMETKGVAVDRTILDAMSKEHEKRIATLEVEAYEIAGAPFNMGSPKQLGVLLFEKLEIHKSAGVRAKRTRTGWATDADVLEQYATHPIVARLLEHRVLSKLKSTYLDALPLLISPADGRIHTSYNQAVAATGRLSSSDPNLQNIPIRTPAGRAIRKAFVAESGSVLLSADYSQIELRVLAHLTEDPALIEVFHTGRDVHRETASRVFGVPPEAVTLELRSRSKVINFGVVYGMGPQRVARETGLSLAEARRFVDSYFAAFPGVKAYIDRTIRQVRETGSVETLLGRRRDLPEVHSPNGMLRVNAENAAVNTPIQGTAADLIKLAMIRLHRRLREEGRRAAMILQVHDELVLEVPEEELDVVRATVKEVMEHAIELRVPLVVDTGHGRSWLEAHG